MSGRNEINNDQKVHLLLLKRAVDKVYTKEYLDGPRESPWGDTQRAQKEELEFSKKEYEKIDLYCKKKIFSGLHQNGMQMHRNFYSSFNLSIIKLLPQC